MARAQDDSTEDFDFDAPDIENKNELGLDAEGSPSPDAYESESAAPTSFEDREETLDRIPARFGAHETGDPTGSEFENGPDVDPNDPNLSATLAEAGAEERKDELGMTDLEEFLDDPEADDEEDLQDDSDDTDDAARRPRGQS